ncbi:MAG: hypothetical protein ISN29_03595 [Gammaproteobacteria bacterium AqS3]|nr:hypothetical protein [Gammaproteobacteria bacterium AqS3]
MSYSKAQTQLVVIVVFTSIVSATKNYEKNPRSVHSAAGNTDINHPADKAVFTDLKEVYMNIIFHHTLEARFRLGWNGKTILTLDFSVFGRSLFEKQGAKGDQDLEIKDESNDRNEVLPICCMTYFLSRKNQHENKWFSIKTEWAVKEQVKFMVLINKSLDPPDQKPETIDKLMMNEEVLNEFKKMMEYFPVSLKVLMLFREIRKIFRKLNRLGLYLMFFYKFLELFGG